MSLKQDKCERKEIKYRKVKQTDTEKFSNEINIQFEQGNNLDEMITILNDELTRLLDIHAPLKTKLHTVRKPNLWFNQELKSQKQRVRRREKIWRRYREEHQWTDLQHERKEYRRMINAAKHNTIQKMK